MASLFERLTVTVDLAEYRKLVEDATTLKNAKFYFTNTKYCNIDDVRLILGCEKPQEKENDFLSLKILSDLNNTPEEVEAEEIE